MESPAASLDVVSAADTAPSTPQLSSPQPHPTPSSAESSPNIARPHFHFRSALTATPSSSSSHSSTAAAHSNAPSPFLHSNSGPASASSSRRSLDDVALQRRRLKERKSRIQQTFLLLSSCSIVLLCLLLAYYNYLLLAPQLTSLFWAVLFSLLLSRPQQVLTAAFERLDQHLKGRKTTITSYAAALSAVVIGLSRAHTVVLVVVATVFVLVIAVLYSERQHLVSLLLLLFVVFLLAFPLAFFLKTCVDETQEISRRVRAFITNNPQFEAALRNFTSSSYYSSLLAYAQHMGVSADTVHSYLDPAALKDRLATFIASLSDQLSVVLSGALTVLAQLSNTLISLASFLGFLYYLLDNRSAWLAGLLSLSPFSEEENGRLGNEMRRSVQSIFICSFLLGLLHMVSTFIAFSAVGIDLCLILSFLAGFCAMLPIFSSWLVWFPAIVSLLFLNRPLSACLLLLIQLFLCFYLDPLVYGYIKPEQSALVGMSIVFGIGAFGSTGVVLGPLLTTVTLTLCNIYVEYVTAPLPQHGRSSVSSGSASGVGSGSESVRLSTAPRLDKQWTGAGFPTFFHAAVDTPASTLRQSVHFALTSRSAERVGLRGYRIQQQQQRPVPLEPPSPLAWQTNPLGQSKPPSTSSSALASPVAANQSLHAASFSVPSSVPTSVPSFVPSSVRDKSSAFEQSVEEQHSVTGGDQLPIGGSKSWSKVNGLILLAAQPLAAPPPSATTQLADNDTQSAHSQSRTARVQSPVAQSCSGTDQETETSPPGSSTSPSSASTRRPAALLALRSKDDEDELGAVPAAVFIHESEDEGPDSAFALAADVVESQRERKQRVIMVPRNTRAKKKLREGVE